MILHAVAMYGPENNDTVLHGLTTALKRYPYANCFIYDRGREILKDAKDGGKAIDMEDQDLRN